LEPIYVVVLIALALIGFFVLRRRPALPAPPDGDDVDDDGEAHGARATRARMSLPEATPDLRRTAAETPQAKERPRSTKPNDSAQPSDERTSAAKSISTTNGRTRDVAALRQGITKMRERGGLFGRLRELFSGAHEIEPRLVEDIEEVLLTSDVGAKTTQHLLGSVREGLAKRELGDTDKVWSAIRERAAEILDLPGGGAIRDASTPTVVLMIGVNGAGKTTTIGKLATKFGEQGKRVLLVAGDTFRAAAVQQIQAWGKRIGCEVYAGKEGADPASVVYDAIGHAVAEKHDVVLCDTAGRLHTKSNLMDELKKVHRSAQKVLAGAPHEVLLVVDGTTGQNALQQAQEFGQALPLTGIVLTKLDGTAKGGVVLAIAHERKLPVRYVGVGERAQDLRDFDAEEFVEALLGTGE
jgi:fused signal recognition particle receptor